MKAVILVGGFGTRLRPLTLSRPKQMLPIGHVTMLERVISRLGDQGIDTAVLSLGYQPDAFIDEFPDGRCGGVELVYAVEPEPLDTAGAIAFAARSAGIDSTFVAVNGDVISTIDVKALVSAHRSFGGDATIALTAVDDPSRFGVVPVDEVGRVIEFVEKPAPGTEPTKWINAGTYVLEPSVLEMIPSGRKVSIERETFPALVAHGGLFAVHSDGYWIDAGTPEAYLQVQLDLIDGIGGEAEDLVDSSASVDPTAEIHRSAIGPGVIVEAGCRIVDSVVMSGVTIGTGSIVDRSIIGAGSTLAPSTILTNLTVVGFDQTLDNGLNADGELFPAREQWDI